MHSPGSGVSQWKGLTCENSATSLSCETASSILLHQHGRSPASGVPEGRGCGGGGGQDGQG